MPAIAAACDDVEIARWIHALPSPYSESDARDYVVSTESAWKDGLGVFFAVVDCASGDVVGSIALHVLDGEADVWVGDTHATLTSGQLMIVPAGVKHGFSNCGTTELHIQSTLAAPVFEAAYDDKRETPRRWLPG